MRQKLRQGGSVVESRTRVLTLNSADDSAAQTGGRSCTESDKAWATGARAVAAVFVQPGGSRCMLALTPGGRGARKSALPVRRDVRRAPLIVELRAGTLGVHGHLMARGFTGDPLASFTFNGAAA